MPTVNVFDRAAEILEEHGWTRGDFFVAGQGYCVVGALARARGEQKMTDLRTGASVYLHLARTLNIAPADPAGVILPTWNDERGRTAAEVIAALREAGKTWEVRMGNIGDDQEEYEFEPLEQPSVPEPAVAPAPAPAPSEPVKEPVPA